MPKITLSELEEMIAAGDLAQKDVRRYFNFRKVEAEPFSPGIVIDTSEVDVGDNVERQGSAFAFKFVNAAMRRGRMRRFEDRLAAGSTLPVVISEGDSWFQFPLLLTDVIDHLLRDFNVWSLDAAGDTLKTMVFDRPEFSDEMTKLATRATVTAFLFSGAGNDVLGADADGRSQLLRLIGRYDPARPDPAHAESYVAPEELAKTLDFIAKAHAAVFSWMAEHHPTTPVFCHGYAYVVPGGFKGDGRRPVYARRDQWVGKPFDNQGFPETVSQPLRAAIVAFLIDQLDATLKGLCGHSHGLDDDGALKTVKNPGAAHPNAHHVDVRRVVGADEWSDEIHPTSDAYGKVAEVFRKAMRAATLAASG